MANNHTCDQEAELNEIKQELSRQASRMLAILGTIAVFIFLVGIAVSQASKANDNSSRAIERIERVDSRVSVQDERLRWIQEAVLRIEKKLDEKK